MVRRPVVDNGWYRALTRDNVELVTDEIARITPTGIETTDGQHREVDLIVVATGYKVDHYPCAPIVCILSQRSVRGPSSGL